MIIMMIKDITTYEPTVGDILQVECGDTLIEATISDTTHDGYVIEIVNENVFDFLKRQVERHAGHGGLESIGYIIGVDRAIGDKFKTIRSFIGENDMTIVARAIQTAAETTPNLTADDSFVKGFRAGANDVNSDDPEFLKKMVLSKVNRLKSTFKVLDEDEYQGRKVSLGKPFLTPDGPKKRSVYVKNPKGNVVKVNFGDKNMKIKKSNPARRKSFRARHNCANPGPRHKARYWSCKFW